LTCTSFHCNRPHPGIRSIRSTRGR
jgi:hypothetical protein